MIKYKIGKQILSFILIVGMISCSIIFSDNKVRAADKSSAAGIVNVYDGRLNVRSAPSISANKITSILDGSYITLISKNGSWWKVEYEDGKYGYCSSSYISAVSSSKAAAVSTSGSNLNVRTGPSTNYSIKAKLQNGKTVVIISESGDFSRILYNGTSTGYVSSRYLRKLSSSESSVVSLSVVNYKQTDSRWSYVTLGSSGKTIGNIGCTTTALAMTESYRTGKSITPDIMAGKLKYSSSGSLYWPSNYTFVTDSDSYLYTIRGLLRKGKPVILGCKKSSGGQHWVVVTGYNGRGVSSSNFTINDPGSRTRTTLDQFLSVYPNFYKIAYYI